MQGTAERFADFAARRATELAAAGGASINFKHLAAGKGSSTLICQTSAKGGSADEQPSACMYSGAVEGQFF